MLLVQSATSAQVSHSDFTNSEVSQSSQRSVSATNNRLSPKMHELLIKYQALHENSKACIFQEATSNIHQTETADAIQLAMKAMNTNT